MKRRTLIAISAAAAFALPLTVQAGGDKASQGASSSGAEKMFQSLDKNKDGALSRDEVKGSPHDKDFATLDKNSDGKLTRQEHAAAPEHASDKAGAGATSGGTSSKPKY